jgi:hypothetical protein
MSKFLSFEEVKRSYKEEGQRENWTLPNKYNA